MVVLAKRRRSQSVSGIMFCMTEIEKWLPVAGFDGRYEVSDHGRVRSLLREGRILQGTRARKIPYRIVSLSPSEGKQRSFFVHRLVLLTFVGPKPDGMICCHNDGDPANNHVSNLRWDTYSENMYDVVRHGNHHHTKRTHCPKGHPLDALKRRLDGTIKQRRCRTCLREQNRAKKARKLTCPQGHPFDGIAYKPDGTVRQRYCTKCRSESVSRQMTARNAVKQTHCKRGHLIEGVRDRRGRHERYCIKCNNASSAASVARKKGTT